MRRNPFFRRLGCAFVLFNIFGLVVFLVVAAWVANLFVLAPLPANFSPWLFPAGFGLTIFAAAVVILGIFGLRWFINPLEDLLEAASRVAEGDYSVRVPEQGSPEIRSLAKAFNNMASRLYSADEKRRNLLADVTHELRTPLTVLQGNLEGILDGVYLADETNLRSLLEETNVLAHLVEDLRTVALAESGALKLKKEPTDIAMLLNDTLIAFQSQALAADVEIIISEIDAQSHKAEGIPGSMPLVDLDPVRMRQVLSNLIANALRYTPAGGKVRLLFGMLNENALIEVNDDGPGISADDLPHVFERFYKATDSGGVGLGLAITRHIIRAHGGIIEARSAPSQGTSMRILLPASA